MSSKPISASFFDKRINKNADLWTMKHRALKNKPYRFKGKAPNQQRPFLQQMLRDPARYKCYQKSRQAGVSENSVSEVLYLCDIHAYRKWVYVFPTFGQMKDFVQTRVEPAIQSSPYITSLLDKKKNNVHLKHIKNCDILFRSGSKASAGEGVDADGVFFDERDRMNTNILDAFKEGLSSSDLALIRDISTPSLPGSGVNISFEKSDKKYWFVKCTKCGHKQNLTYPDNLVKIKSENRYTYKCTKCGCVDCIDRSEGEWVPEIVGIQTEVSGYQLSQLDCPWISASEIVAKKDKMFPQFFYNYVLGRPYVGSNLLVLQQHINNCISDKFNIVTKTGKIVAGVDWGDTSWMVIGMLVEQKVVILYFEKIAFADPEMHIRRVKELFEQFKVDLMVCDSGYGKDRNAVLFKELPAGRVVACNYVDTRNSRIIDNVWGTSKPAVTSNRTVSLRVMARAWQRQDFIFPQNLLNNPNALDFFNHLKALAIKLEEVEEGVVFERVGHIGADHFSHACNYLYIGAFKVMGRSYVGFMQEVKENERALLGGK